MHSTSQIMSAQKKLGIKLVIFFLGQCLMSEV